MLLDGRLKKSIENMNFKNIPIVSFLILYKKIKFKLQNHLALLFQKIFTKYKNKYSLNKKIIHIVFSYDRALQLDNYIRTFKHHCTFDLNIDFYVIYKFSSKLHFNSYKKLKKKFYNINFINEKNFKKDINAILNNYSSNQILSFGVDDIEFIRSFSLKEIHQSMNEYISSNKTNPIFSLRHGKNLNKSIQCQLEKMELPEELNFKGKFINWKFKSSNGEWGYPLAVDCHFYPLKSLKNYIKFACFCSPNSLEAALQKLNQEFSESVGISYLNSICFNNPNNRVQNEYQNFSLKSNTDDLAKKYLEGYVIEQRKEILRIQDSTHKAFKYKLVKDKR